LASTIWGLQIIYWKQLIPLPASEILAHRVIWSFVLMTLFALVIGRGPRVAAEFKNLLKDRSRSLWVLLGAVMTSLNWLINIWAINNDRVLQSSFGSYISPLISVLIGLVALRERLSLWQLLAVLLVAAGIVNQAISHGSLPWVSLAVAGTFAVYGFCKKVSRLSAVSGMVIETSLIAPAALIYLAFLSAGGQAQPMTLSLTSLLLVGGGLMTIVPLLLFAFSVNSLPLSVAGLLQYLAPSLAFCLGVFVYHEPFSRAQLISFGCTWTALFIFSLSRTRPMLKLERLILDLLFRR